MEENMAANAVEEVVDVAPEVTAAPETEPAEDGVAAVEAPEDVTKTKAFSERLKKMSAKAVDDFVREQGWVNDITGETISDRAGYAKYQKMRTAQSEGKDPALSAQVDEMRGELARYRLQEQDAQLQSDPEVREIYTELRGEVMDLVDYCRGEGKDVSVRDAFQAVLAKNQSKIIKNIKQKAEAAAAAKYNAAAKASPGKLSGGDTPASVDYATMSDADFEAVLAKAKKGELRAR